ncbi:MAG TPA: GNAT family N-acetyltransferase [Pyrinomonadaceae bacterium]|jgi:L-amino acid N-acyltransferase YncA|nr:GNAT family N-acetyltransferase [Pyrinomonadaceae bacterium]
MAITVRNATRDDAPKVAEFAVALFELHAGWNPRRFTQVATLDGATRFYGDRAEKGSVLVAESDGEVVGFAYFEYEATAYAELATRVVWLHDIFVDPAARGGGAGMALIDGVKNAAKELGADKVLLTVAAENAAGHKLFKSTGFEKTMDEMMLVID